MVFLSTILVFYWSRKYVSTMRGDYFIETTEFDAVGLQKVVLQISVFAREGLSDLVGVILADHEYLPDQ